MSVLLKDAPGGAQLIEALTIAARDFSLLYAGTPDDKARTHLDGFRASLERDLSEALGAEMAAVVAERFAAAVMGEKRKLEAKGGGSA